MVQDQPGSPPAASTEVVAKEGRMEGRKDGRKEEEDRNDKGVGRMEAGQEGKDSKDVEEFVRAHALSSPEHHSAPHNATCPPGPTTVR